MDVFEIVATEEEIKKEKEKARKLRKSRWWKRKCAEGVCHFCNKKIPSKELTMDHLIPLIRGGKTIKANVVPACKECNNKKKYLLPFEWEEYLIRLRTDSRS